MTLFLQFNTQKNMINPTDQLLLDKKGISSNKIQEQLLSFAKGFPFLTIVSPVEPGNGILCLGDKRVDEYLGVWNDYLQSNASILKFVPASGAASRMFKDLFEFLDGKSNEPEKAAERKFFDEINQFAFAELLDKTCKANTGKGIQDLIQNKQYNTVVEQLLLETGLNYGSLPKGLLLFHSYLAHTSSRFLDNLNRALSTMLLGLLVFYGANELIFRVCNVLFNSRTNLNDMTIAAQVASAPRMTALIVVLLAPFVEEVLFRGLVFGCLKEKSRIFAYILSCALFAFLHVWTAAVSNWDLGYLILMLQYLVPGLVFAWAYEHSGTLWTSILLHMLVNALSLFTIAS